MIPQQLSLTNFMCYRQAELNFAGIHVACLAGENGAGKSALLDAITWAVWGRSRARRDDELIHLGEDEMTVEFTFGLGEQTYRVLRQRKAGKRGSSLLDFQVKDDERWRSIGESSIRDTQAKIEHILRLDYETFINSAFLRQGRADEFTVKTAAERKRVLGDILGLDRWAGYEERAKGRLRAIQNETEVIELRLREIESELARRPEYEAELQAAQATVEALSAALQEAQVAYQRIEAARTELQHAERQIAELSTRIAQAEQELTTLAEERAAREQQLAEYGELLAQAGEIEAGYAAYRQALTQEQTLGAKLTQSVELNERRVALESQVSEARHRIEAEREIVAQRVVELQGRLPDEPLLAEYEEVQAQLAHLTRLSESREAAQGDLAKIAEEQAELRARNGALRTEMDALKEKIAQLEQAGAECPLCEQALTDEHRLRLLEQFRVEGRASGDAYRANQAAAKALAERAQALHGQIAESDDLLRDLPALQRREAALAERIGQGQQAADALKEAQTKLAEVEQRLQAGEYAPEVRGELARVLKQAEELGYDAAAHAEARRAVAEGQTYTDQRARLGAAQTGKKEERAALKRLDKVEKRSRKQIETEQARRVELEQQARELQEQLQDAPAVEAELQRVRGEEAAARQRLGAAQQRLEACKALEQQQADKRKRRDALAAEQSVYDELRIAFSVRGVPAMIIEAAVPEIEVEANRLLARMTGGRMHMRFDTQRETQAGEVRETLEIKISDELGTRPYEMYSVDGNERVYIRRQGLIRSLPIKRLWDDGRNSNAASNGCEVQPADYDALCYDGGAASWLPVSHILRHPAPAKMFIIELSPGNYSITLTPNHSIFVMTPEGLVARRVDELQPGDFVLTPRRVPGHRVQERIDLTDYIRPKFIEHRAEVHKPLKWDEESIWSRCDQAQTRFVENNADLGEFLGIAVAEASGRQILTIAVGSDRKMAQRVVTLASTLFDVNRTSLHKVPAEVMARYVANAPGISSETPQTQYRPLVGGRLLSHIVGSLIGHGAQNKRIPSCIFNASEETKRAFLRGLVAGDGYVRVRPEQSQVEVCITTVSKGLVADVVFLCRQLGIWARVEKHGEAGFRRGMMHHESFRIAITGQANANKLLEKSVNVTGYASTTEFEGIPLALLQVERHGTQKRMQRDALEWRFPCGQRVVPLRSHEQYERMSYLLRDWNVLEVSAVEEVEPSGGYVYDLVVPGNHSFVAGTGAILVHNSGGEQFRVNFAIRIALSKLLARRAGAQLQTLVIDEGFGTQDTQGRERLVEAINAIQDDFARVLVITHIDELKDAFPARIEVSKTPGGSLVEVV